MILIEVTHCRGLRTKLDKIYCIGLPPDKKPEKEFKFASSGMC